MQSNQEIIKQNNSFKRKAFSISFHSFTCHCQNCLLKKYRLRYEKASGTRGWLLATGPRGLFISLKVHFWPLGQAQQQPPVIKPPNIKACTSGLSFWDPGLAAPCLEAGEAP